jgi:hypothetical protein
VNRPTGQDWKNWKRTRGRQRVVAGMPYNPDNWFSEWESCRKKDPRLPESITAPVVPSPDLTALEIIQHRIKKFKRKREYEEARQLIDVEIPIAGPYGILHFGDPHVDDDGTDLEKLIYDINLVKSTTGMFAANIGDSRNNWVGRLARLYGEQGTSAKEALILADWFLRELKGKWAYIIGGNHDAWSGADDPLEWISDQVNALYEPSEARIRLVPPCGEATIINARHDFKGNSQWNSAHPVMKASMLGVRDDIFVCGHKHVCGYGVNKSPDDGRICHCLQIGSYKIYDRYAREKGFRDQHISPCAVTVIDPSAPLINRVQMFWDAKAGADYLTFLRSR